MSASQIDTRNFDIDDPRFRIRPVQQMTAACTGAMLTSLFMTPLDVVKIRMQTQQKAMLSNKCYLYCNGLMDHLCPCGPGVGPFQGKVQYKGTFDAIVKISQLEGVTTLWSGLSPTLFLAMPCTVIYFVFYEQMRVRLKDRYTARTGIQNQPMWIPLISGSVARAAAVSMVSPIELVRTKMQSQKKSFSETRAAVKELIKVRGLRGLWRGLGPTLMRDVPFSGVYWTNFENIKKYFGKPNPSDNTFAFNFAAGGTSGCIAAIFTLPFDVIKTHQQIELGEKEIYSVDHKFKPKGQIEMLKNIYNNHGIKGLFTGLVPRIFKVAPACAIMIASFEYGKSFFQEYNMKMHIQNNPKAPRYNLAYGN